MNCNAHSQLHMYITVLVVSTLILSFPVYESYCSDIISFQSPGFIKAHDQYQAEHKYTHLNGMYCNSMMYLDRIKNC